MAHKGRSGNSGKSLVPGGGRQKSSAVLETLRRVELSRTANSGRCRLDLAEPCWATPTSLLLRPRGGCVGGMTNTVMTGGENVGPGGPRWGQPLPSQEAIFAKVEEFVRSRGAGRR